MRFFMYSNDKFAKQMDYGKVLNDLNDDNNKHCGPKIDEVDWYYMLFKQVSVIMAW